jgi:hypothetical protein
MEALICRECGQDFFDYFHQLASLPSAGWIHRGSTGRIVVLRNMLNRGMEIHASSALDHQDEVVLFVAVDYDTGPS